MSIFGSVGPRRLPDLVSDARRTARQDFANVWDMVDDTDDLPTTHGNLADEKRENLRDDLTPTENAAFTDDDIGRAANEYANAYVEAIAEARGCTHDLTLDDGCTLDKRGRCLTDKDAALVLKKHGFELTEMGGNLWAFARSKAPRTQIVIIKDTPDGGDVPELLTDPVTIGIYPDGRSEPTREKSYRSLRLLLDDHDAWW